MYYQESMIDYALLVLCVHMHSSAHVHVHVMCACACVCVCVHVHVCMCVCVCVCVCVGSWLATKVFICNLLAMGRGWVMASDEQRSTTNMSVA